MGAFGINSGTRTLTQMFSDMSEKITCGFVSKRSQVRILSPRPIQVYEIIKQIKIKQLLRISRKCVGIGHKRPALDHSGRDKFGNFSEFIIRQELDFRGRSPLSTASSYFANFQKINSTLALITGRVHGQ